MKTIEDRGKQLVKSYTLINKNYYDTRKKLLLKEKEISEKILAERENEINTLNNKTEYDKLMYHFKNEDGIPISSKGFNRH